MKCLTRAAAECSAIICYPLGAPENTALLNEIAVAIPLVLVDRIPTGVEADTVMTDNFGSMLMGLKHLRSLGHTRIAYFMEDNLNISSVRDRHAAYHEFMKQEVGLSDPHRWERRFSAAQPSWQYYVPNVEKALIELLSEPEPITAIACQQDAVLDPLLESCVHLGIRLPHDLSLLSFCDLGSQRPMVGAVHRLVHRSVEMGHMAARRVQQKLNSSSSGPPQIMRLMTDLYPAAAYTSSLAAQNFVARRGKQKGFIT